ncbi:hypothetical protein HFD88_002720 [Aspergillus terreus]|nr:hypothetical protein HFD88_002720 [Aspergillus terreus]
MMRGDDVYEAAGLIALGSTGPELRCRLAVVRSTEDVRADDLVPVIISRYFPRREWSHPGEEAEAEFQELERGRWLQ